MKHDQKLLAAEPHHVVASADHRSEHSVTGCVSTRVVDLLEMIEVEEQDSSLKTIGRSAV
jgi:hypothetical protein